MVGEGGELRMKTTELEIPKVPTDRGRIFDMTEPIIRLEQMDAAEYERVVGEWAYSYLKGSKDYYDVVLMGGSSDSGRDLVAYLDDTYNRYDIYQCKHYDTPLKPSEYWIELGKLCYYTYVKEYRIPEKYYIVASKGIGAKLRKYIENPTIIGAELIKQWDTYCGGKKQILADGITLTNELKTYIEQFDFSIIKDISPIKFLEQFSQTNWYKYHFGGGIKKRPVSEKPNETLSSEEKKLPYVKQLLEVYSEEDNCLYEDDNELKRKALNKTELGKEIKNIYVSLRDEHNKHREKVVSHYQIYNQCVEHECSRNHFYGWSITYEKMKQYVKNDLDNGDKLILDTAKYVLENDEFKKMSDISEKMGKIAVKLSDAIICSKYDDDDVKDLLKIMKVKNAVMDLQMAVERSGLKVFLLKNAQFLSMNDEYELELRKSNYVPYIGEHKPELCNKGMNDIFIDLVDRMMFVQYMMLMGIFEGFWDILIELSKEDGVEGNLSQPNGIRRGSFIHKNIGKEIVNKEAWMYKIHDDKDSFYFLANKRTIHIEKNKGKSEVYGVAYPKEDIGLFEKEIVTESND